MISGEDSGRSRRGEQATVMTRSSRSIRRICLLFVLVFAFAAVPAGAYAQNVGATDDQYEDGVFGLAAGGNTGGSGTDPVATSGSQLPFTGLDVVAIAAIGVGLVGAGFAVRRAARPEGGSDLKA
jgi:hypothetical protein